MIGLWLLRHLIVFFSYNQVIYPSSAVGYDS